MTSIWTRSWRSRAVGWILVVALAVIVVMNGLMYLGDGGLLNLAAALLDAAIAVLILDALVRG